MRRKLLIRAGVVTAASATAVLGFAGAASAHVTVSPSTAPRSGDATVSIQVPNEEDTATTTKVEIDLPVDRPIAAVDTEPVAGWTAVSTTSKLTTPIKSDDGEVTQAVTKVVWTASSGGGIKPGQFQQFPISLDSLPDADSIEIKALQTYSNGDVVRWIDDPAPAGQDEPDHPAPILTLVKGDTDSDAAAPAPAASTPAAAAAATPVASSDKSSGSGAALGLGIAALVVAVIGAGFGFLAFRRTATRPAP